jgi:uncharacterized protein (TIGR00296 family)
MSPRDVPVKEDNVVELKATPEMCLQCFHVLVKELASSKKLSRSLSTSLHEHDEAFAKAIPPTAECPLFVTWDKKKALTSTSDSFSLRGCIGTLSPRPLSTSITEYALISALRDRRFDPIKLHEVPYLRVAVSLLINYETCLHCHDWSVGIHGIIIRFKVGGVEYSATYLPEVAHEQGWTQDETVKSLVKKSGYQGVVGKDLAKSKIETTRYQSSKHRATYQDYVSTIGIDILEEQHSSSGSCATM